MANWHYHNENREKIGPIAGSELKRLAQQGIITPDTFIEDPTGRIGLAKDVRGLKFANASSVPENPSTIAVPLPPNQPVTSTPRNDSQKPTSGYFYTDENGNKYGPITEQRLQTLVERGVITQLTQLETEIGQQTFAGEISGLTFLSATSPSSIQKSQSVPVQPPAPKQIFCTNCGNTVSEQAVACMSCGAKPIGHKKFCRQCGVSINPEQVVCIKCGVAIGTTGAGQLFNDGMSRIATLSTNFNVGGKPIGDIIIFAAAGIAFISFLMPWIEATGPFAGKVSTNGFFQYAFWLAIFFIYPVWMALAGKRTYANVVSGFVSAGMGFVFGIVHILIMLSVHEHSGASKVAFSFSMGVYVFFCACILLIAGIILTGRSSIEGENDNISPEKINVNFKMFWICSSVAAIGNILCFPAGLFLPLIYTPDFTPTMMIGISILMACVGAIPMITGMIIGIIFLSMLLYRLWTVIPANIARTTPGRAVGFCFIPLFHYYWIFVAFWGLGKDMNTTLKSRGIQYHVKEGLGLILCILPLPGIVLSYIPIISVPLNILGRVDTNLDGYC